MFQTTEYAGKHMIVDLYGVSADLLKNNNDLSSILEKSAVISGATVLHNHFHHFGEDYGCTGVIVLAESHISIHTWPEKNYASIDVYMCGKCDPKHAVEYILSNINHEYSSVQTLYRGTETS
jgi:S-adenosylmethionine decarboxylase